MDRYHQAVTRQRRRAPSPPALLLMALVLACAAQPRASTGNAGSATASAVTKSSSASAATDGLPKALQGINRATGACKNEAAAEIAKLPAAPEWAADLSCALPVAQLRAQLSQANLALIDMRPASAYQAWHINGALNLNLADLHGKPYWRNKQVVLLGSGKAERELYGLCAHLKQTGYTHVKVLRGGMAAWLGQQGPILGRVDEPMPQMLRLSPAEFWLEAQNPDNVVLIGKAHSAMQRELPLAMPLAQDNVEGVKAMLARRSKELKKAPMAALILVTAPAIKDEQIIRMQQALAPIPLLVYTEGRDALVRHNAGQKQIWLAQTRGPRQPGCGL